MGKVGRKAHAKKQKEAAIKEKRKLEEPKFIRVCPKCGSAKVIVAKAKMHSELPSQYKCRKCSYTSYFFPETTKELLKKKKNKKISMSKLSKFAGRNIKEGKRKK